MVWASRLHQPALLAAAAEAALCLARELDYASQTPGCDPQRTLVGARRYPQGDDAYFTADGSASYAVTVSPLLLLAVALLRLWAWAGGLALLLAAAVALARPTALVVLAAGWRDVRLLPGPR